MKRSRIFVLFLSLVLAASISFAQDCKFDVDKKNPATNEVFRAVSLPVGPESYNWKISLEQKGEKYYIGLTIKWGEKFKDTILEGQKISFTLEDGNKVFLVATKDYAPSYVADNYGEEITAYYPKGELRKNALEMLSKSPIVKVRVKLAGEPREITKIRSRQTKDIMQVASCLMQAP